MENQKVILNILLVFVLTIIINGCCTFKEISKEGHYYQGIIYVPADAENKNGIIKLIAESNFEMKALLYRYSNKNSGFEIGDSVGFKVYKRKDFLLAKDLKSLNLVSSRYYFGQDGENLINLHNRASHSGKQWHKKFHLRSNGWTNTNIEIGNDGKSYNIGEFIKEQSGSSSPDTLTYAVDIGVDLLHFFDTKTPPSWFWTYIDVSGSVMIKGKEYMIVRDADLIHSNLPH